MSNAVALFALQPQKISRVGTEITVPRSVRSWPTLHFGLRTVFALVGAVAFGALRALRKTSVD